MYKNKTIIDNNGNLIARNVLFINDTPQFFVMKDNYEAVELLDKTQTVNDREVPYFKPHWDGSKWNETATAEELAAQYPVIQVGSSDIEKQADLLNQLILDNLNMQMQIDTLIQSNL